MLYRVLISVAVLAVAICLVRAQDNCGIYTNCRSCIRAGPACVWCSDQFSNNQTERCTNRNDNFPCQSGENFLGSVNISENVDFNDNIQVRPQRIKLQLRQFESQTFSISIRPAENYPLDLYYLMDLSYSMRDDLDNLKLLSTQIAQRINSISNNSRLGFGSFVDKPVGPYVSTIPSRLLDPCLRGCRPPYSFYHSLNLTRNSTQFATLVNAQIISGNLEHPEGGFDAIIQAVVCQDVIGWLPAARHLLLFATDASYHQAGDGKLGGVVRPNEGKCYLERAIDPNNNEFYMYNAWEEFDYPSIGMLNDKFKQFDIVPIFAVISSQQSVYTSLQQQIEGLIVAQLTGDSSNVVDIIAEAYEQISTIIQVRPEDTPGLEFTVTPTCAEFNSAGECTGVDIGQTVTYDITVTLSTCENINSTIRVIFFGDIAIEVEALCECNCDSNLISNSSICSGQELVCGVCNCNQRYGQFCQCEIDLIESQVNCIRPNSSDICSNRGECICGECICNQPSNPDDVISGRYCECDNFSCERDDQLQLCGGSSQGVCECGNCQCQRHPNGQLWTKLESDICDCTPDTTTCLSVTNVICSERGNCQCGQCICDDVFYTPESLCLLCNDLTQCSSSVCLNTYRECVIAFNAQMNHSCNFDIQYLPPDLAGSEITINNFGVQECRFVIGQCSYTYYIAIDILNATIYGIRVEMEPMCFGSDNSPLIVGGSILGGIVVILVIITIIFLIVAYIIIRLLDLREYSQFMSELEKDQGGMNENPLYKKQEDEIDNPFYGFNPNKSTDNLKLAHDSSVPLPDHLR